MKVLIVNRKAYRDYEIIDKHDAGLKLTGSEVKSLREGRGNLKGSYIKNISGKLQIVGFDIPKYSKDGSGFDEDTSRSRYLLLHKNEIENIKRSIDTKGFTAVPLKIYLENNLIKLLVGIGRGKKKENIKQDLIKRQQELEIKRILKEQNRGYA